jgi:hypothetical protein
MPGVAPGGAGFAHAAGGRAWARRPVSWHIRGPLGGEGRPPPLPISDLKEFSFTESLARLTGETQKAIKTTVSFVEVAKFGGAVASA